jgi:cytochrome c biogenesis protein CcdA
MRLKTTLRLTILLFLVACLITLVAKALRVGKPAATAANPAHGERLPDGDRLIVYYAHGKFRCWTCSRLEECAHEAVFSGFPRELAQRRLEWRVVDYEEPGNAYFADRYKLPGPSIVLVRCHNGQPAEWEVLQAAWELLCDKPAAVEYVRREVRGWLEAKRPAGDEVLELLLAAVWALSLGILTSINPCPMTTNVAAISYIGRRLDSARLVFLSGLLYTLGQVLVYLVLGLLVTSSALSAPEVLSRFLQRYGNPLLGPLLIVVAMLLLDLVPLATASAGVSPAVQRRVDALGIWGALLLGVIFAISFCPTSAGLFFLVLLRAVRLHSGVLLPAAYGLGATLPTLSFALLLALGSRLLGKTFERVSRAGWWARRAAGVALLLLGVYCSLEYVFGVPLLSTACFWAASPAANPARAQRR